MLHFSLLQPGVSRLTLLHMGKQTQVWFSNKQSKPGDPRNAPPLGTHPPSKALRDFAFFPCRSSSWNKQDTSQLHALAHASPSYLPPQNVARPYLSFKIHVNKEKGQSLIGIFPKKINMWAKLYSKADLLYLILTYDRITLLTT